MSAPVSEAPEKLSGIHAKLSHVMSQLGWMEKRGKNEAQKYAYVMADDVAAAVREELIKVGISVSADCLDPKTSEYESSTGKKIRITSVLVNWIFTDAETKESVACCVPGEAMDAGDKAVYKAMTGSMKYALKMMFLLPTGDDPEEDSVLDKEVYASPSTGKAKGTSSGKPASQPVQKTDRATPAAATRPASPAQGPTVPFGKHKGKQWSDASISDDDLMWLQGKFEESVARQDEKWHDKNVMQLQACNDEISRRLALGNIEDAREVLEDGSQE
jgi:hypothetical protein